MDWKEALGQAFDLEKVKAEVSEMSDDLQSESEAKTVQNETLKVSIDRKARKGKTATIIEGFLCDDERLKDIAKTMKMKIGAGGSARAGEILLQGDWKEKSMQILREMGYKVKG